jgi:hypothetical protein
LILLKLVTQHQLTGEIKMKWLMILAFAAMSLLGIGISACEQMSNDVYENEAHGGYPGPSTRVENRQ